MIMRMDVGGGESMASEKKAQILDLDPSTEMVFKGGHLMEHDLLIRFSTAH